MDYQQEHIRNGYEFAVLQARTEAKHGDGVSFWLGQFCGLATWAKAAPNWERVGHQNEIRFLRGAYARRHSA